MYFCKDCIYLSFSRILEPQPTASRGISIQTIQDSTIPFAIYDTYHPDGNFDQTIYHLQHSLRTIRAWRLHAVISVRSPCRSSVTLPAFSDLAAILDVQKNKKLLDTPHTTKRSPDFPAKRVRLAVHCLPYLMLGGNVPSNTGYSGQKGFP